MAVSYLGLCFWHFGQEVDSWTYLYATVAIWLFTILGRTFWKNQAFRVDTQWPSWCPSRVSPLAGGVTRIDVYLPLRVSWQPGQHFYLRFPSLSPLDNHPFTICNIPRLSLDKAEDGTLQKATFFARSHSGFTRRLASFAGANVDISEAVWLEGPYGGISRNIARRCDLLILIAGGSGITACLSWLLHCTRAMAAGEASLQRVKLVWIVREREHLAWITGELETARAAINGDERLELIFYITRSSSGGREKTQRLGDAAIKGSKEEMAAAEDGRRPKHHMFKPSIASVLPELLGSGRNMIIGKHCSPPASSYWFPIMDR